MWVEFDHFSKLLGCCFPGHWRCSGVKQDKQTIKSKDTGNKNNKMWSTEILQTMHNAQHRHHTGSCFQI